MQQRTTLESEPGFQGFPRILVGHPRREVPRVTAGSCALSSAALACRASLARGPCQACCPGEWSARPASQTCGSSGRTRRGTAPSGGGSLVATTRGKAPGYRNEEASEDQSALHGSPALNEERLTVLKLTS